MQYRKFLFDIATVVISVFCLFPNFTVSKPFRLIVVLSCVYIIFLSFKKIRKANYIPISKIVFALVLCILISYLIGIKDSINFLTHISILVVFVFVFEYFRIKGLKTMKNVVFILSGLLMISTTQTIMMLNSNAAYARLLTKNQDLVEVVGFSGGYGLVYACLLAFFSILFLAIKRKKVSLIFRAVLILVSFSSLIMIWKAGFFLGFLLLVFGLFVMFIGVNKHKTARNIVFFLMFFGIFLAFQTSISDFTMNKVEGTKYEKKIEQILGTDSETSISSGEFDERENRYLRDLNLMLEYPIIGCWDFKLVGKHSFILDTLAQYGLIFGTFFLYIVFIIPFRLMISSESLAYTQSVVFFGILFVFLLLNSFAISIIPVVFIIFPFSNYILKLK